MPAARDGSWTETVRIRLQLALLIIQVLAIVFGGMMMFLEVRGVVNDVGELKSDVRQLRDSDAKFLVFERDIGDLRDRVRSLEQEE